MSNPKFTWGDLKAFCNSLPEEYLSKQVMWCGEERGGNIDSAERVEEDFMQTDYGWEPRSVQEPEDLEGMEVALEKGSPLLYTDTPVEPNEQQSIHS